MKLADCRREIDSIDTKILSLLGKRAEVVKNVALLKAKAGLPIVDAERESAILQRVLEKNKGVLDDESTVRIFSQIIQESRRIQTEAIGNIFGKGKEIF